MSGYALEVEVWWLLALPLFFALGWLASRLDLRSATRSAGPDTTADAYYRGLNYLLNEQPDRAIDSFIEVVRIEPETIELHFALGNLFRRRGETDRAIRVHQNLADRSDLDASQREHALYELGQDFQKAGLLDQAEDAFNRLEGGRYAGAALRHRLEIAQMVRDWPLSIELAQRLSRDQSENRGREIAHYRCELAERARGANPPDIARARLELEEATQADPGHPRAWLQIGLCALAEGEPEAAIEAWRKVERVSPGHLSLIAQEWLRTHEIAGRRDEGIEALQAMHEAHPSIDSFSALVDALAVRDGIAAARQWATRAMQSTPSLLGLDKLLALKEPDAQGQDRAEREQTQQLIREAARRLSRYVCRNCGFKSRQFYWHCPGCNLWDSYAPKRTEELERG
jgi:lipopolysaccharide assembly protein B